MKIIEKSGKLNLNIASKAQPEVTDKTFYFGAGWDKPDGPVDLDIVCAVLANGKLQKDSDLVYYDNRFIKGVYLSKDNTTGEGEGDDESIVIETSKLEANVDSIVIGLVCYTETDFSKAPNPHYRVCDGGEEKCEQMAAINFSNGQPQDTLLVAFKLEKSEGQWSLTNVSEYHKKGNSIGVIEAFGELYQ